MAPEWLTARPIAHRGLHNEAEKVFENSLSAFERAIAGNYAIECDLQYSADGVAMVFHDFDLARLCGLSSDVRQKTSAELQMLSIGGSTDKIPTFKKMLNLVKGTVPIIAELKGRAGDDDGFAGAVLDDLDEYEGNVALMSFEHHILRDFRNLGCPYPLGLTAEGKEPDTFFTHEEALSFGLDFISYDVGDLPNPFIEANRKLGVPVISWTVKNPDQKAHSDQYADQITFEGFDPDA